MQAAVRRSCVSNFCLGDRDGFLEGDTFMCVGLHRQEYSPMRREQHLRARPSLHRHSNMQPRSCERCTPD